MARLLTEGFECDSTTYIDALYENNGGTISSSIKRSGSYSLRANASSSCVEVAMWYGSSFSSGVHYYRACVYINSMTTGGGFIMAGEVSGAAIWGIQLNSDNTLALYGSSTGTSLDTKIGSSSSALSTGAWHRIEVSEAITGNVLTAYVDGTQFATGANSGVGNGSYLLQLGMDDATLAAAGSYTCDVYFDDVGINDSSGASQNSLLGDGKVLRLKPNAAGDANTFSTQTGGTAGAANNYTRVNEVSPDSATTYNGDNVVSDTDMFNCDNSGIGASDTVNVVQLGCLYRNNVADATTAIKFQIEKTASGTKSQSSAIVPNSTTWKFNSGTFQAYPITLYKDPDGAVWTQTTLDSMQIGYIISTGSTNRIDVSTVWAVVDYTPAAVTAPTGFASWASQSIAQPFIGNDIQVV